MARRGRPLSFDRQEALRRAMEVFWARGYDGATLEELQSAMGGITAPSFYNAFGSKEALFREAVEAYRETVGGKPARALTEHATARGAIEAMLYEAVNAFSTPGSPRGCLVVVGAMNCRRADSEVQDYLQRLRREVPKRIKQRLERGVANGDVPAGLDLAALASFYTAVLHGLAIQARDGATRKALRAAVACALAAWDGLVAAASAT